jgi:transposase
MRLDLRVTQALEVLKIELRPGFEVHVAIGEGIGRVFQDRAVDIAVHHQFGNVHLRGVDRDRDLIRLGRKVREHVARIVAQPLGFGAFAFGREESIRPPGSACRGRRCGCGRPSR